MIHYVASQCTFAVHQKIVVPYVENTPLSRNEIIYSVHTRYATNHRMTG